MKRLIAAGLTAALATVLGGVPPASAQSGQFAGFYCQLDLEDLESAGVVLPPGVDPLQTTTDSKKVCSGGPRPRNILLECRAQIDNWPRKNVKVSGVPCMVNAAPCGIDDFLENPFTSSLHINPTGKALLKCHFKPS
jgi:hypothetical protein